MKAPLILASLALAAGLACHATPRHLSLAPAYDGPVPAPLILEGKAFERALAAELPAQDAVDLPGVHHFFRLSDTILSGAEPAGQLGLETLADLGVKTIVSVDGKAPAAEAARALGMRYVHIPIQYKGITPNEMARLAKTFRELDAPFYVHCFHGKHRGPAGAAVGRVVRDGTDRETAIAEMRQYAGTSKKYEGLYRSIAARNIPASDLTAAFAFDFPAIQRPGGIVGVMVTTARTHDTLFDLRENAWAPLADRPDLDARNEAHKLSEAFAAGAELDEVTSKPTDFTAIWQDATEHSAALTRALERVYAGHAQAVDEADRHFEAVRDACSRCHATYRNED
jgi:protein tyrosine phosphatase (PTP) superfamily phosphohydrolase (DUF442 family)